MQRHDTITISTWLSMPFSAPHERDKGRPVRTSSHGHIQKWRLAALGEQEWTRAYEGFQFFCGTVASGGTLRYILAGMKRAECNDSSGKYTVTTEAGAFRYHYR